MTLATSGMVRPAKKRRLIDWVLCAKELRHALPRLMRRKPLDLNRFRTPLNTNLTIR